MNNENEQGDFGEYQNLLDEWVIMKFEGKKVLPFISRSPNGRELAMIAPKIPGYGEEIEMWDFFVFESLDTRIKEFREITTKAIIDWLNSEGFLCKPQPCIYHEKKVGPLVMVELSSDRPRKIARVMVGFTNDLALIATRNPFFYFDDTDSDLGEEWKRG